MRILKSSEVGPGVCGLALTPSVALGGYLMKGVNNSDGTGWIDDFNTRNGDGGDTVQRVMEIVIALHDYIIIHWRVSKYPYFFKLLIISLYLPYLFCCSHMHVFIFVDRIL